MKERSYEAALRWYITEIGGSCLLPWFRMLGPTSDSIVWKIVVHRARLENNALLHPAHAKKP